LSNEKNELLLEMDSENYVVDKAGFALTYDERTCNFLHHRPIKQKMYMVKYSVKYKYIYYIYIHIIKNNIFFMKAFSKTYMHD